MKAKEFLKHMEQMVGDLMDSLEHNRDYCDSFNVTIVLRGKSIDLEMHADLYSMLENIIEVAIQDGK